MKTNRKKYYLIEELNGQSFQKFLKTAASFCNNALLVVRDEVHFMDHVQKSLEKVKNIFL